MRHRAGVGNDGGGGGSMDNKRKWNYQLLVKENLMDSSSTSQVKEGEGASRDNDDSTTAAHREVGHCSSTSQVKEGEGARRDNDDSSSTPRSRRWH